MSFKIAKTTLSTAVASAGTFTIGYPEGTDAGHYDGAKGHKLWSAGLQTLFAFNTDFTLAFGLENITVTYNGTTTIPADSQVTLQLDEIGSDTGEILTGLSGVKRVGFMTPVHIELGAPDAPDPDGVAAAQAVAAPGNMLINGALAVGGVATFDVPRAVTIDSSGADTTQTATITGTDEYGKVLVEAIAFNGTTVVVGKKAFKTVTQVAVDIALAGNGFVGTSDVLGLPLFLAQAGLVVREMEDGAIATAGVVAAGVSAVATATTGDVRGTYDPNSAMDGATAISLLAYVSDPSDRGVAQFAG